MFECPEEILALMVDTVNTLDDFFALCRTSSFLRRCAFRPFCLKNKIGEHFPSEVLEVVARKKDLLPIFESFRAKKLLWENIENISPIECGAYPTLRECFEMHDFIVEDLEDGVSPELAESMDHILSIQKAWLVYTSISAVTMPYLAVGFPLETDITVERLLENVRTICSLLSASLLETFPIPKTTDDCYSWGSGIWLKNGSGIVLPQIKRPESRADYQERQRLEIMNMAIFGGQSSGF